MREEEKIVGKVYFSVNDGSFTFSDTAQILLFLTIQLEMDDKREGWGSH